MQHILNDWEEEEIYRIDHFLGEEVIRSIIHLRFGNEHLIEPSMRNEHVSAVKIELCEKAGLEGRGGYFDEFGMIRDVSQNRECVAQIGLNAKTCYKCSCCSLWRNLNRWMEMGCGTQR